MTFGASPGSPPPPPPPPPAPPQLANGGIRASAEAQRAAAAAAAGMGFNNTVGKSGIQGSKAPSTTSGKTLLGQ